MKDLLVSSESWRPNDSILVRGTEILDVAHNHISRTVFVFIVLSASYRGNMTRETGIDDNVFFTGMLSDRQAAKNFETMAMVQLVRNGAELIMEIRRERES